MIVLYEMKAHFIFALYYAVGEMVDDDDGYGQIYSNMRQDLCIYYILSLYGTPDLLPWQTHTHTHHTAQSTQPTHKHAVE